MSEPETTFLEQCRRTRVPGNPKPVPVDSGWQVYGFDERSGRLYRLEKRTITCGNDASSWVRRVEIGRL